MKIKKLLIPTIILLIPLTILLVSDNYFSEKTQVYLRQQATLQTTLSVQKLLNQTILLDLTPEELVVIKYKENNSIATVIINTPMANRIVKDSIACLSKEITSLNNCLEIPLGTLISKAILAGSGPLISIPIIVIPSFTADLTTNHHSLGINIHQIEVRLDINVVVEALIPLNITTINHKTSITIFNETVYGDVPQYYYSSATSDPNFPYVPKT